MVHWPAMLLHAWNHRRGMGVSTRDAARRTHSLWLTRAFNTGREYPRIPVRAAAAGGYSRLMARPGGPALAERWWAQALLRVEPIDDESDE